MPLQFHYEESSAWLSLKEIWIDMVNMCQLRVLDTRVTQIKTQSLHKRVQFSHTVGICLWLSDHSYPATWFTGLGSREWPQTIGGSKNDVLWWFKSTQFQERPQPTVHLPWPSLLHSFNIFSWPRSHEKYQGYRLQPKKRLITVCVSAQTLPLRWAFQDQDCLMPVCICA